MKLNVIRHQFGKDATNGMLFIDGVFECYTLEDEVRDVKVMSETAIPLGTYKIKFRNIGGFDTKYKARYGTTFHKGMLELQDVPNFKYILIHTGNTDEHTAGCLLLGETQQDLDMNESGFIGHSGTAYKKMYTKVAGQLLQGKKVTINYTTITKLLENKPVEDNKAKDHMILADSVYAKLQEINGNVIKTNAMLKGRLIN